MPTRVYRHDGCEPWTVDFESEQAAEAFAPPAGWTVDDSQAQPESVVPQPAPAQPAPVTPAEQPVPTPAPADTTTTTTTEGA